jgi:hypothetical protein
LDQRLVDTFVALARHGENEIEAAYPAARREHLIAIRARSSFRPDAELPTSSMRAPNCRRHV